MFRRFVAASSVGVFVIAVAACALVLFGADLSKAWLLTAIWCFVPFVWGIWAILTPRDWFPRRLPLWGAVLGLLAGTTGALLLNMPMRIFAFDLSLAWRIVAIVVMTVVYYGLWMLVRKAYRSVSPDPNSLEFKKDDFVMKKAA